MKIYICFLLIIFRTISAANVTDIHTQIKKILAQEDEYIFYRSLNRPFIIISLGINCQVAWYSRELGLRDYAYPFDWCISSHTGVYRLIKNDFKEFFKRENLIKDTYHTVKDTLYDIRFAHDFPAEHANAAASDDTTIHHGGTILENYMDVYDELNQKYQRRIERFYWAINSGKKIFFVRIFDITKQDAIELHDLIKQKFPALDYELVVLGQYEEYKESWNVPHLHTFYVAKETVHDFWPGYAQTWQQVYSDLSIWPDNYSRFS